MPFYELFSSGIPSAWPFFASGSASASHSSAIALALSRPIGFGLVDLWLPSSVALSYRRLYESALDVLQNRSVLATEIRGGAANLFGKNGARPLFDLVAFDEYSSLLDLKFSIYADGASFPNITTRQAVSFEGEGSWDFSLSHKLYWEKTRTLTRWSDGFSISISQKPEDTWFRKLVFCLIPHQAVSRPDEYGPEDSSARPDGAAGDKESYSVARWLSDVFSRIPILRDTWNAAASVSCTDSDLAPLVIRAELSYETRIIQAGILSIGFKAALNQSVSLAARSSSASVYGGGYEISLDAKLTF